METVARTQTAFRIKDSLLERIKWQAKKEQKSVNAFVEEILEEKVGTELVFPKLPQDFKVSEEILNMKCIPGDWKPSREELEADPRLAHIMEECGYEA